MQHSTRHIPLLGAAMIVATMTLAFALGSSNVTTLGETTYAVGAASTSSPAMPTTDDSTVIGTLPGGSFLAPLPPDAPSPLPTNRWWSGGIDQAWPAPLFAWPMTVTLSTIGAVVDAPGRTVNDRAVMYQTRDPLRIFPAPGVPHDATVLRAGDWDVTFRVRDPEGETLLDVTAAQGSPYVFVRSAANTLSIGLPNGSKTSPLSCGTACGSALVVKGKTNTYVLISDSPQGFVTRSTQVDAQFPPGGGLLTVAIVAPGSSTTKYLPHALKPIADTRASFTVEPQTIRTTFRFPTTTLIGVFPHQFPTLTREPSKLIGTYETVRGPVRLYEGIEITTALPRPALLPGVPPLLPTTLRLSQLRTDVAATPPEGGDVYAAAKELLRKSSLLAVTDAVGESALKTETLASTRAVLADWCTAAPGEEARYFGFDDRAGGLIARPPAFGSEHYNDHHFHYGYFLHAAAIVALADPTFDGEYGDCIRLLARDVASFDRNDASFPFLRAFDPYAGHSWAAGLTVFGDGNNQESTSEAMQAWYGMALYGRVTGNTALEQQGLWLWTQEAQAARTYWLNATSNSGVFPPLFRYPMASIVWGGKFDYATFFDASDAAIRGIQFFPFSPALFPVATTSTISRLLSPLILSGPETIWKTNARFYHGLINANRTLPASAPLDPVYSFSYLWHWQAVTDAFGFPTTSLAPCNGWVFTKGTKRTAISYRFSGDPSSCTAGSIRLQNPKMGWNVVPL